MTVGKGMKVEPVRLGEGVSRAGQPGADAVRHQGPAWVAAWPTYPHWKPKEEMNDKLLILEDTDGDGKADKRTVFADDLHNPTGFEFCNGGVIVAQAPDLVFLKDTNGDDKADVRERVLHGLDSADTHHTSNSFALDPGRGALLPGRDVPPHAGRDAVGPAGAAGQRRRLPLRAADAEVRGLRHLWLRQPARPRLRPLGPGHRHRRHRRPARTTAPLVLRPRRLPATKHDQAAAGLPAAAPGPCRRHRDPLQPALPRRDAGQPARRQRDRLPGHPAATRSSDDGAELRRRPRSSRSSSSSRPELPAGRRRRSGRTARSTSSTGRTRSSATCSTTSATPAATASTAASIASPTRAGRCSKPAKIAGEPIDSCSTC